jgi:hypothetical protein
MAVKNAVGTMLCVLAIAGTACSKRDIRLPGGIPPSTDQQTVKLKEIITENEPTPSFTFTYDDSGYVSTAGFAGELMTYRYFYKNQRIDSVSTSATNGTYLLYRYTGAFVSKVEQHDRNGLALTVAILYDRFNRVSSMEWRPVSSGTAKTTTFDYYGNGNLHAMKTYYPATGTISLTTYQAYDNKKNVDGFAVFKDFFDHIVLLPSVRLQHNNPTKISMLRGNNRIEVQNEYTYSDDLPIQQRSTAQISDGSGKEQTLTTFTSFNYYNSFR